MCKIRFIVETYSSAFDVNGNRSHYARITSTLTAKSLAVQSDGPRNIYSFVNKSTGYNAKVHEVNCEKIPRRQWQAMAKQILRYEHNLTLDDILQLEQTT